MLHHYFFDLQSFVRLNKRETYKCNKNVIIGRKTEQKLKFSIKTLK